MAEKTPAYYRARLNLIAGLIKSEPDERDKVNNNNVLLRNGLIPTAVLNGKTEEQAVTGMLNKVNYSNAPLTFTEKCTWNTWFVMHPEKQAGTEIITTSIQFPITIKGTQQGIIDVLTPVINEKMDKKQPWEMTFTDYNIYLENKIAGIKLSLAKLKKQAKRISTTRGEYNKFLEKNVEPKQKELSKLSDRWHNTEAHKAIIQKALSEGKPVPAEVLKDYPELQNKTTEQPGAKAKRLRIAKAKMKLMEMELKLLKTS